MQSVPTKSVTIRHIPVGIQRRWVGTKRWSIQEQYCIVELQVIAASFYTLVSLKGDSKGQICTNGASSDRISRNTLKNKVVVMANRVLG